MYPLHAYVPELIPWKLFVFNKQHNCTSYLNGPFFCPSCWHYSLEWCCAAVRFSLVILWGNRPFGRTNGGWILVCGVLIVKWVDKSQKWDGNKDCEIRSRELQNVNPGEMKCMSLRLICTYFKHERKNVYYFCFYSLKYLSEGIYNVHQNRSISLNLN